MLDPELYKYTSTTRQTEILTAYDSEGSARKAGAKLDISHQLVSRTIREVEKKAANHGYAPGHFTSGVAKGYRMGKVTVQRGPDGVERVWERQHPEQVTAEMLLDSFEERILTFKPLKAAPKVKQPTNDKLINFLGLFDLHIGEKVSSDDPMGKWDIEIAKKTIVGCATHAFHNGPKAKNLVLCFGGDAMHYDGLSPVTPTSKHVLHSDGDFEDMADATVDIALTVINEALATHEHVHLIWATGNHDLATSKLVRRMLARIYVNEPRLTVVQSKLDYYALVFGKVFLGVHHGHGAKLMDYAGIFASMFREMWGMTKYAYGHRGHEHHLHSKERYGMYSLQHPSLAPSDDYALGKGLVSQRGCIFMTYHEDYGEVGQLTTRPEML